MSDATRRQLDGKLALLREAGKSIERRGKRLLSPLRRAWHQALIPYRPGRRKWSVGLPFQAIQSIQTGTMEYSYRGTPMIKNPFEVALYPLLLWRAKPRTVIEIGSYRGASALWFADILRMCNVDAQVFSVDIEPPAPPETRDDVHFLRGDANALGEVFTPDRLAKLQRPLLVFEDSNHVAETTLAVLEFFATVLRSDEYIVVEDAAVTDLGWAHRFNGGPGLAISRFLAAHRDFEIDTSLCDFYGHNFTGNPNGYLRRR